MRGNPLLATVDHVLAVLDLFNSNQVEVGVAEVGRALGLSTPSAYRLLATLEVRGFVRQSTRSKRYRLGPRLFRVGRLARAGIDLLPRARPYLEELARLTGASAYINLWDCSEALSVDTIDSSAPVLLKASLGSRHPAHASSAGKCLLAFRPEAEIDALLARPLVKYTPYTITDPSRLRAILVEVRATRSASSVAEHHLDVAGIAAPVFSASGEVIAALGVGLPVASLDRRRLPYLSAHVTRAGDTLSEALGWRVGTTAGLPLRTSRRSRRSSAPVEVIPTPS